MEQFGISQAKKTPECKGGSTGVKNTRLGETGLEEYPSQLQVNGEHLPTTLL